MVVNDPIRVLIADDNRPFRRGVRLRLEQAEGIVVVGEASTGHDAVTAARAERADVVLMDLEMPGTNGIEATRTLVRESQKATRVIVLTSHGEQDLVLRALSEGASGYLLKTHDGAQLIEAIRAAHRGDGLISTRVTSTLLQQVARSRASDDDRQRQHTLSPSETRVVELLSRGVTSNEAIAKTLQLSANTVRTHIQASLKKTDTADRTQLALWGARVLTPDGTRLNRRT
ncbi:response regulator transcription factor [Microbacterium sp. KSW4-17]|uniref:Response regulator transcription factor n=1 Tax=Microbacterium galbum TaxID=3075994 RepID=A0ABU3T6F3_9MICO|nr:response regulator transcription factor [Microbacterium sp. KSW4-17]MDU0366885.1 response regulator transcription factor [Microbacterium sp. KSW4-17]